MTPQGRSRRLAALTTAVLAAGCVLAPSAGARVSRAADGDLSPRLAKLAKPSVRSAPPAKQAAILDVAPSGPGSLLRDGNRVLVDVRFDHGAAASVDALRDAGARIVNVSASYQTVTVAVPAGSLHGVAAVPRVDSVIENLTPILAAATCPSGDIVSEGFRQLRVNDAVANYGPLDGSGVTVGILSDSFDRATDAADGSGQSVATKAADDVASGDLPGAGGSCGATPTNVVDDSYSPSQPGDPPDADEGRAMAQIVHDLAPGAALSFATAFNGLFDFAGNIATLQRDGADVIVDDVIYLDEPFFQDGPVARAVNDVTAAGASYFSAAGNSNLFDGSGRQIASWETPQFRGGGGANICPPIASVVTDCLDFNPSSAKDGTFGITVPAGRTLTVDLQWAQPWYGVTTDLDAYLLDSSNGLLAASEDNNVSGTPRATDEPFEALSWDNSGGPTQTVRLVIARCGPFICNLGADDSSPRVKFILLENGGSGFSTEYPQSTGGDIVGPTVFGHSGAANAVSVGAIRYNTTAAPESFSSRGPVVHYFEPVDGTSPARSLPAPQVISKPDLVATDGGATTFFAQLVSGTWRFYGTSAAAPHAAAIAALELEAAGGPGSRTPAAVEEAQTGTADPVGAFGSCDVGAGIVNALDAVDEILNPGSARVPAPCQQPASPPIPPESSTTLSPAPAPTPQDVVPPQTFIARAPVKIVQTQGSGKLLTFRFRSSEGGSTFRCKIDQARYRQCDRKLVRWFGLGAHVIRVKAVDAAGNVDPTPAVYRFRVKRSG